MATNDNHPEDKNASNEDDDAKGTKTKTVAEESSSSSSANEIAEAEASVLCPSSATTTTAISRGRKRKANPSQVVKSAEMMSAQVLKKLTSSLKDIRINLTSSAAQNQSPINGRLRQLIEIVLDQVAAGGDEDIQTKVDQYIELLCESIKLKDVELSTLALLSMKEIIESDLINAKCLQLITEAVTKIEFSSTETELVEEGYHSAVRVCCSMIKCQSSDELTNGSISEIIIFCFRVVNSKLIKWLRTKAARTLLSITKLTFRRLCDFPEDVSLKPSYQIRLRLGGSSSQSTFKELADQSLALDNNSSATTNSSAILRIITERNQPYNLAFINDYFCYLASLINPNYEWEQPTGKNNNEEKVLLGLKLLGCAFNEAASFIGQKSCLIYITRNNVCYNLVSILKTSRSATVISHSLNMAVNIFVELRCHLKYQFEAYLERLMEMLAINHDPSGDGLTTTSASSSTSLSSSSGTNSIIHGNLELKADVLNSVLELFRNIEHFPHELYYNYDCDPYSSNIYENLIQICSKNCFSHSIETYFTPIQLTSFKCLLANLGDIHSVEMRGTNEHECLALGIYKQFGLNPLDKSQDVKRKVQQRFPRTYQELIEAKKCKRLLWSVLDKFNARPKDGIQFIKENQLIDNNEGLVQFLKDNLRVDKKVLGEFLSKEENRPIRETFIRSLDFSNLRIDEALRFMLEKFRLPGESQLIERILDSFSIHWFEQNPGILQNSDQALSLAYAIIMLNVDQHSKKVKPMTCDEFDRNLLGPKSDRIYDRKLLDQIYTNIRDNEIVLPDEQIGSVRQRYLWKCTIVKSERVDALYWIADKLSSSTLLLPPPPQMLIQPPEPDLQMIDELPLEDIDRILFGIMWSPTVAALSFIFDKIDTSVYADLSRQIVDEGFIRFAHLCARHGHLDNLVVSLCKFTTDLNQIPHHNHSGQRHQMSDKNSLAALTLLSIIRDYANCMRDSWSNVIKNILQWYCSRCMDDILQVDDFALQRKLKLRMREVKRSASTMNQQSSTFLRSVYTYFAGQQPSEQHAGNNSSSASNKIQNGSTTSNGPNSSANSGNGSSSSSPGSGGAPSAIQVLIQTIQNAQYCQESLVELITALTITSIDGDPQEVEDAEVFKLEIFTQVILNNKDHALSIWPKITHYFSRQASLFNRSSWLGERIISAGFRVAIRFKPKPDVFGLLGHIITLIDPEIVRGDHTFVALMTLTELHSPTISMDAKELEACFNQVIFLFCERVLDGCDPIQSDKTLNRAINLLSKIFLKHHKLLKELPGFALIWYAILDSMEKYIKANSGLKEAAFELVKNMVLVMDNEQCMSVEMKDITRTKFMFWEIQSGSDY